MKKYLFFKDIDNKHTIYAYNSTKSTLQYITGITEEDFASLKDIFYVDDYWTDSVLSILNIDDIKEITAVPIIEFKSFEEFFENYPEFFI